MLSPFLTSTTTLLSSLLAMAFFTLLERKTLGYIQSRKGPNKVSLMGLPQPLADAMKLFMKEHPFPSLANLSTFIISPMSSLLLALILWSLYPPSHPSYFFFVGAALFLCVSSLNVYTTLGAGWSSNSKYALLGALRSVAQTISYEVSMTLILLTPLFVASSLSLNLLSTQNLTPAAFLCPPLTLCWFITMLAETNRTPFDFAEGESELVSGFNTEYGSGSFALIFMAEYVSILAMSIFSSTFFLLISAPPLTDLLLTSTTMAFAFLFLWTRGTMPRMRYDHLMYLTWKSFLLFSITTLLICSALALTLSTHNPF